MKNIQNKWLRGAIPALLLHCSIGTVYCWSIFSQEIANYIGFSKGAVEWAFSFAIFFLGMSAAFLGGLVEKNIHKSSLIASVVLSSGVSKMEDIQKAVDIVGRENVSLLHCITSYPAPETEYNLKIITTLKNLIGIECGVSDHSLDPILVPSLSIACGGTVIEKHITLSRKTAGLDDPVALEPEQFAMMVHVVHQTEAVMRHYGNETGLERTIGQLAEQFGHDKVVAVLGDGVKKLAPAEEANYGRTNRSLHFMRAMKKGEVIGEGDVAVWARLH